MDLFEVRKGAVAFIQQVRSGENGKHVESVSLVTLFRRYTTTVDLKPNTIRNYRQVIYFYLQDWLKQLVASISREMVEKRFYKRRDKGIAGGQPTYSQATKVMRILSALMNYAIGDELIESNPVDVLKLKKVDRSIRKRTSYLRATEVRQLLDKSKGDNHPVTLAVQLMIFTGLRKKANQITITTNPIMSPETF